MFNVRAPCVAAAALSRLPAPHTSPPASHAPLSTWQFASSLSDANKLLIFSAWADTKAFDPCFDDPEGWKNIDPEGCAASYAA